MGAVRQDLDLSRRYARVGKNIAKKLGDAESAGKAMRMAGHVELLGGKSLAASEFYAKAWELFSNSPIEQAHTAVAMIQALSYVGQYDRAFEIGEQALATYNDAGEPFRAARVQANLGNVLHRLDRLEEAEAQYRESLPVLAEHRAEADLAIVMRNYGVCLMGLMKFEEAEAMYRQAREIFAKSDQSLLLFEIDLNRAYLFGRQGFVLKALSMYRELLGRLPQDSGYEIGHCLLDESDFLLSSGLLTDAFKAAAEAEGVFLRLKSKFEIGKARLLQSRAALKQGRIREAEAKFRGARPILRKEPNANWRALLYQTSAEMEDSKGNPNKALRMMKQALVEGPAPERVALVASALTDLALRCENLSLAQETLNKYPHSALLARLDLQMGSLQEARESAISALRAFDEHRAALGSLALRRASIIGEAGVLGWCLDCFQQPEERFGVVARIKDYSLAEMVASPESHSFESDSSGEEGRLLDELREFQRLTPSEGQASWVIPRPQGNQRILEFFEDNGRIRAFVLQGQTVQEHDLGGTEEFQEISQFFHFQRSRDSESGIRLAWRALEKLSVLLEPVLKDLPFHVTIGRDGPLMSLPIHALPWSGGALMDSHHVEYVPSATTWDFLVRRSPSPYSDIALVGAADELAPQIAYELAQVERLFGIKRCESVGDFESLARRSRLVHIAAHGIVREDRPLFSSMKLGEQPWSVFDVLRLSLKADLVVLSGCSTGFSVLGEARESQGFIEALFAAGARSIVASLWDASDEPAAVWMENFYQALQTTSIPVAYERATQMTRARWPHPAHWAQFALFGAFLEKEVSRRSESVLR